MRECFHARLYNSFNSAGNLLHIVLIHETKKVRNLRHDTLNMTVTTHIRRALPLIVRHNHQSSSLHPSGPVDVSSVSHTRVWQFDILHASYASSQYLSLHFNLSDNAETRMNSSRDSVLQNTSCHPTQWHSSRASLTGDRRTTEFDRRQKRGFCAFPENGNRRICRLHVLAVRYRYQPRERKPREPSDAAAKPGRRRRGARRWLLPTDTRDFGQLFDPRLAAASFHPHVARDPAFRIPRSAFRPCRDWSQVWHPGGRAPCDEGFLRKRRRRRAG